MRDTKRATMWLEKSIRTYNELLEQVGQVWMETNDEKAKKLKDKISALQPAFIKMAKSACGIKLMGI